VFGPEVPAERATSTGVSQITYSDALSSKLTAELEEEGRSVKTADLAGVAQQYEDDNAYGPGMLRSQAAKFYAFTQLEPSETHRALASLPFVLVLSTCHDKLLAKSVLEAEKTPLLYCYNFRGDGNDNVEFIVPGSVDTPVIYNLFGDYEEPKSLVLSENDLLDFLIAVTSNRPPLPNSLRRALQRFGESFLFVGFGIRHWYLRVLLKALVRTLDMGKAGSSVALEPLLQAIPDSERQQIILFYQRGMRVEICQDQIPGFLAELGQRLQAEGGVAAETVVPGPRPRVFISYASADESLAARIFSSLQRKGFEPWLDKDALRGGEDWNLMIEDQLRETDFVLVLQTPALAAKKVGYVNKEIAVACERSKYYRKKIIIPHPSHGRRAQARGTHRRTGCLPTIAPARRQLRGRCRRRHIGDVA
jgi:hypothetical protein